MTLVEMQPWHLVFVAMNLRGEDMDEFGLAQKDPQRWACQRALQPGLALTVLGADGLPVACFGFTDDNERGAAVAWLVATQGWRCSVKTIRKGFEGVWKSGVFTTILAYIRPERPQARRFIEWLGFSYRGTLPAYGPNGEPMELFSVVRQP